MASPSKDEPRRSGRKGRLHEEKSACRLNSGDRNLETAEYIGEAAVDIIAVHGLASMYETTWCAKLKDGSRYSWLHEKLGVDVPQARIMGFEYGSEWYGDPSYTNLDECGTELLRCIIRDRQHVGRREMCPTRRRRPIIFVAHSFGGLVVKQALVAAYREWKKVRDDVSSVVAPARRAEAANCRDFLCSVTGIIFLGTPHRGSSFTTWANIKMTLGWMMGQQTHQELVKVLSANSEPLAELQRAFQEVCNDSTVMDMDILPRCYRETRALKIPPYMVVPAESAFMDQAENGTMDANHMEMNKFLPGPDSNYDKVLSDIQQMLGLATRSVSRRLEKWRYGSLIAEDDRNMVEHRLDPSLAPQTRHFQLKLAAHQSAPYTCHWLDQHLLFKDWKSEVLDGKHNVLWIHGKPASGKSVLAAYAINSLSLEEGATEFSLCDTPLGRHECGSKLRRPTVLYYFCGVDRSRDKPEGILGTLIHQLLSIHDTDDTLFAVAHRWKESTSIANNATSLGTLLKELISLVTGQVFVVIDALDENPKGTRCLEYLLSIASALKQKTRLLVISQRQEALRKKLEYNDSVANFSITDFSQVDIQQYIQQKTEHLLLQRPELSSKQDNIVQRLQGDVEGIFELVNTTIDHLETHVSSVEDVDAYLDNLPASMQDVYDKIFERLRPASRFALTRFRTALQLLAISATPMTVLDVQTAIKVSGLMRDSSKEAMLQGLWTRIWTENEITDAKQDVIQLLDSLVQVDANHFVTLVHPSLRQSLISDQDFKGQDEPFRYMPNHSWYQFSETQAHMLASDICIAVCADTTLTQANAFVHQPPLMAYAWNYWAYHLRASGFTLDNKTPHSTRSRNAFDRMLRHVQQHTLSFLNALAVFVTNPIDPVPGHYSLLEYRQSLQRAQHSTAQAITTICNARQTFPVGAKLHKEKERIPTHLNDIPEDSTYQSVMRWTKEKTLHFRAWLLKHQTQVTHVRLDHLFNTTALGNLYDDNSFPEPVKSLLESCRALRQAALTFAVNPIHAALIQQVGSAGFSPIHLLVHVAQLLEEAASFPYWDHLTEVFDPADAFICTASDPQSGPAKFVLRFVDWQRPNKRLAAELGNSKPHNELYGASGQVLTRQLRELSDVTPHRWLAARFGFDIFQTDPNSDGAWFQALVANPVSNLHIKDKLYMLGKNNHGPWPVFLAPAATLDLHAPTSLRDAPVKQVISALPSMFMLIYAKYIATLLELFAEVPRAGVVAHFIQLTTSRTELLTVARYAKTLTKFSLKRLRHVPLALLLYYLRLQFFPQLGAHAMSHSFRDLLLSYHHPAAYLNLQSFHDAYFWFKYAMGIRLWNAVGQTFVAFSRVEGLRNLSEVQLVADTVVGVYHLVTLERNLFGLGFSLAILTASAQVIMYDRGNMGKVGEFTFWYLVMNGFGVLNIVLGAMLDQNRASFKQGLAVVVPEMVVLVVLAVYADRALWVVASVMGWVVWPVTGPALLAWRLGLYLYAPVLRLVGVGMFVLACLVAVLGMEKAIWDPHDLVGSRRKVLVALRRLEGMRDRVERLTVGGLKFKGVLRGEEGNDGEDKGRVVEGLDESWDTWDAWDEGTSEQGMGNGGDGEELGNVDPPVPVQPEGNERNQAAVNLNVEEAVEVFTKMATKELGDAFGHLLQSGRHVRFDSSGGWGSAGASNYRRGFGDSTGIMDDGYYGRSSMFANDRYSRAQYQQQRGNGWRFGGLTPGDPMGSISYSWTDTTTSYGGSRRRDTFFDFVFPILFGLMFVFWAGMMGWLAWSWWTAPTSEGTPSSGAEGGGVAVGGAEPKRSCWQVGPVPVPPVYFGYSSCEGWFWGFDFGLLTG